MRIALVIFADFPEGSGPPRRLHMIGKGFAHLGHEVHVVVPQRFRQGPLYQEFDGLRVHWGVLTSPNTWSRLTERLRARWAAWRLISRLAAEGLDWLMLSNPSLDGLPLLLTARRHGVDVMAMYDDLRSRPEHPSLEDRVRLLWLESADRLIPRLTQLNLAISSLLKGRLSSLAPGTPTFLLPPLVDPDLFESQLEKAAEFRAMWSIGDVPVISYLGTYWRVEGLPVLLEAARRLVRQGVRFRLMISGAAHVGLDCDDVSSLVREFSLDDVVTETGWLGTDMVISAMSAADILVVPKLNDIANVAGMPTKLAEYLAIGRAVVASRVGDIPLYLTDGTDALLCEPSDPVSLTQALHLALTDEELRNRLAAQARLTARSRFDYHSAVVRLESAMSDASRMSRLTGKDGR